MGRRPRWAATAGSGPQEAPALARPAGPGLRRRGPVGRRARPAASTRAGSSSLGQQHEDGSLQEAAKAAQRGHEPVGAEAGVRADHTLEDVGLGGKRGQSVSWLPRVQPQLGSRQRARKGHGPQGPCAGRAHCRGRSLPSATCTGGPQPGLQPPLSAVTRQSAPHAEERTPPGP